MSTKFGIYKGKDLSIVNTWEYLFTQERNIIDWINWGLMWSAEYGHINIVKYLVENGADIHARDDLALRISAENGHKKIVEYLTENGADIHARDDQALRLAAQNGHKEVAEYLTENGADILGSVNNINAFGNYLLRDIYDNLMKAYTKEHKSPKENISILKWLKTKWLHF
jgi:ankyrin repeat protein